MTTKIITAILTVFMLLISTAGMALADEVSDTEKTDEMKAIEKALKDDGIDTSDWTSGTYECWHIARDVQIGLWNNKSFETALARVKFKKDGSEKQHFVLESNWKIDNKPVYIEPATGMLYKDVNNLMEKYSGVVSDVRVADGYSRVQIYIEVDKCTASPSNEVTINVELIDRNGAASPRQAKGNPVKGQPLTVKVTKADGNTETFPATTNKTDENGKWIKKIKPCPDAIGPFYIEVEVATTPVPAKAKKSCVCIVDLQKCILPLEPWSTLNPVGEPHELIATLLDSYGYPVLGAIVNFTVTDGPHAGTTGSGITDDNGRAVWRYIGTDVGEDSVVAYCVCPLPIGGETSPTDDMGEVINSNEVYKRWIEADAPSIPPLPSYVGGAVVSEDRLRVMMPWIISMASILAVYTSVKLCRRKKRVN